MITISGLFTLPDFKISGMPSVEKATDGSISCLVAGTLYNSDPVQNPIANPADYVLNVFKSRGLEALRRLDGSFLLIITLKEGLIATRDYFGSGPQFYFTEKGFGTHPVQALKVSGMAAEPDLKSLSGFLKFGYIPSPYTGLVGVRKLPAGALFQFSLKSGIEVTPPDLNKWVNPPRTSPAGKIELVEEYKMLHQKAIRKRIQGAKRVGLLLSGGYDSAGNLTALREIYSGPVGAVSVGFKDNPWSEVPLARQLAEKNGANLTEYLIDGSELEDLPRLIAAMGDPFQEGGVMVNHLALGQCATEGFDVVLGGDGNDQHFGTAGREVAYYALTRKTGLVYFQKALHQILENGLTLNDSKLFRLYFHNRKILRIMNNDEFGFTRKEIKQLLHAGLDDSYYTVPEGFKSLRGFDNLYELHHAYIDIRQIIQEVILFKAGQVSALHGVPMAFPYMDLELSDFIHRLPRELRLKGTPTEVMRGRGSTKYIHREAYRASLPQTVAGRKKQGGFAPLPVFFGYPGNLDTIKQLLKRSSISKIGFDTQLAMRFLDQYQQQSVKPGYWFWFSQVQSFKLMNLTVLLIWWEQVMNGKETGKLSDLIQ